MFREGRAARRLDLNEFRLLDPRDDRNVFYGWYLHGARETRSEGGGGWWWFAEEK